MNVGSVHEGSASNFEAQPLARHVLSYDVGRNVWFIAPYSNFVHVNITLES
jgi:hypothetical protein